MFKKLFATGAIVVLCLMVFNPQAEAVYWGSSNEAHLQFFAVMDTSSATAIASTVLNYTGPGKIYMISVKSENATASDPFVIIDIDGVIDTLQIVDTVATVYISPYDAPDDDTAAVDGYSYSTTYGRMDVWFNEYCIIKLYSEAADAAKEAMIYVAYGTPNKRNGLSDRDGAVHLKYNVLADTTSKQAAALKTSIDYSGSGILYALGIAGENFAGADPFVVVTIDDMIDTMTVVHSTDAFWLIPFDTPDDDTGLLNPFTLSADSTYHPANIMFEKKLKVQIYNETLDVTKQTQLFMSYGTAE